MSDFFNFANVLKAGEIFTTYKASQQKVKLETQAAANTKKQLEVQAAQQTLDLQKSVVEAAAQLQREETYYSIASAVAVGLAVALAGGVIVKLIKAFK